jgi:hypothetical protein
MGNQGEEKDEEARKANKTKEGETYVGPANASLICPPRFTLIHPLGYHR